jgi:hypothetical protein
MSRDRSVTELVHASQGLCASIVGRFSLVTCLVVNQQGEQRP